MLTTRFLTFLFLISFSGCAVRFAPLQNGTANQGNLVDSSTSSNTPTAPVSAPPAGPNPVTTPTPNPTPSPQPAPNPQPAPAPAPAPVPVPAPQPAPLPMPQPAPTPVAGTVRILPIGDSITAGDDSHASYRWPLWKAMVSKNINFDFVGPYQCGAINCVPNPMAGQVWNGKVFDVDHGGVWGIRSQTVAENSSALLASFKPDIVLLHLGTNDVFDGVPAHTLANDLTIITAIRQQNPNVVILMAQLIPAAGREAFLTDLNSQILIFAQTHTQAQSPIIVVNQSTGFDTNLDTTDGIHPNPIGEQVMADRWLQALLPFLP